MAAGVCPSLMATAAVLPCPQQLATLLHFFHARSPTLLSSSNSSFLPGTSLSGGPQQNAVTPFHSQHFCTQQRDHNSLGWHASLHHKPQQQAIEGSFAAAYFHSSSIAQQHAELELDDKQEEVFNFYDSTVEKYAQQPVEVLSLQQMLNFGRNAWDSPEKLLKSARYVQRELPKRLARRLLDLQLLPHIVVTNPHIKAVYKNYYKSFETFRRFPAVKTLEDNMEFTTLLRKQLDQHAPMLDALAAGLRECKSKELVGPCLQLDNFFDNMLRSRISRRVIAEQHLQLDCKRPGYIGIISTDLDVQDSVDFAAQKTKQVCTETYGQAPDVVISGDVTATIPYIPAHLDYMLYELLKNACRAVVEFHRHNNHGSRYPLSLPPVHVRICSGVKDVTLRISDQGGGVPDHLLDKVWQYGFTTTGMTPAANGKGDKRAETNLSSVFNAQIGGAPILGAAGRFKMAGLGFGLPLSRLYARYFGGELRLQVIPGYGCDAYLTLRRLEEYEWQERTDEPASTHFDLSG